MLGHERGDAEEDECGAGERQGEGVGQSPYAQVDDGEQHADRGEQQPDRQLRTGAGGGGEGGADEGGDGGEGDGAGAVGRLSGRALPAPGPPEPARDLVVLWTPVTPRLPEGAEKR